jgi:hypothetical protein
MEVYVRFSGRRPHMEVFPPDGCEIRSHLDTYAFGRLCQTDTCRRVLRGVQGTFPLAYSRILAGSLYKADRKSAAECRNKGLRSIPCTPPCVEPFQT